MLLATTYTFSSLALIALISIATATPLAVSKRSGGQVISMILPFPRYSPPLTNNKLRTDVLVQGLSCPDRAGYTVPDSAGSLLEWCMEYGDVSCSVDGTVTAYFPTCRAPYCTCSTSSSAAASSTTSASPAGPELSCATDITLAGYAVTGDVPGGLNQSVASWCLGGVVNGSCTVATVSKPSVFQGSDSANVCSTFCTC